MGRPRLPLEEKLRRGTANVTRERQYLEQESGTPGAPGPVGPVAVEPEAPPGPLVPVRSYLAIADAYVSGVLFGDVVAGRMVRSACRRQREDLAQAAEDETWPYVWDPDQATRACHFLEQLPHVEGKWATPLLVLEPWQVFLVSVLFGWRLREDPTRRRFTTFYLEVARKAAKSTLMAGLAYYHLLREDEPGAQVICGATTGAQARMVFGIMQKMARRSRWLQKQGVQVLANVILAGDGEARPVNSKAKSLDGLNPSVIILDEGHAQNFALHDVLKSAQGARSNPLMLIPTTAGYDLTSVGYALHQQVEKLLEGIHQAEHILGIIYTIDADDDWRDERAWLKANPMLGISPKLAYMQKWCQDAKQVRGQQGEFRVKGCCQWLKGANRWLDMGAWDRCADETLRIEDFAGQRCWIGGDLASVDDLAALGFLFERGDDLVGFVRCYLPEDVVEARARAVPEYRSWAEDGLLVLTEGSMIDFSRIEADIRADCKRFKVQEVAFDQYGSIQICGNLANDKIPATIQAKRAPTFTPPARDLEARVNHGKFRHDGNSLFKWAASNAVVTRRTDDTILPKKEAPESPNKIDPIDAILQAMASRLRAARERTRTYQMVIVGGRRKDEPPKGGR